MSIEALNPWIDFWFLLFGALMVCILFALIMHFFVPKIMRQTYFKEPYFSPTEVELFTGFPLAYMRTAMMMRLAGWPESGKKRGIPANAHEVAPVWFQVVSRVFIRTYLVLCSLFMALLVILSIAFTVLDMW